MQARHRLGDLLGRLAMLSKDRQPLQAREYAREAIEVLRPVLAVTGDRRVRFDLGVAWLQAALAAESL